MFYLPTFLSVFSIFSIPNSWALESYVVEFNFDYPDYYNIADPLILTLESEWDVENYEIFSNSFQLDLYEGSYKVSLKGNGIKLGCLKQNGAK